MEDSTRHLIDASATETIMPNMKNLDIEGQKKLQAYETTEAVYAHNKIETLVIPKEQYIEEQNYVIDLSDVGEVTIFQKTALQNLLSKHGDVAIYFYMNEKFMRVGMGDRVRLNYLIPLAKQHIFNNKIRIYRDYQVDKPVNEVTGLNIDDVRLNL